jgi:hypothetical protein
MNHDGYIAENSSKDYRPGILLSSQVEEELIDDALERKDIEHAILKGRIDKTMTEDIRGTRYRLDGPSSEWPVHSCPVPI